LQTGQTLGRWPLGGAYLLTGEPMPGGILVARSDGRVELRSVPAGEPRLVFDQPLSKTTGSLELSAWAFTPDGATVVLVDSQGVHVWDRSTGQRRTFPINYNLGASLTPDGKHLGTVVFGWRESPGWIGKLVARILGRNHAHEAVVVDLTSGDEIANFPGMYGARFSLDGRSLAVYGDDLVEIYDFPLRLPWRWVVTIAFAVTAACYLVGTFLGSWRRRPKPAE